MGENLAKTLEIQKKINGITISPKKNFCVIKIWLAGCEIQNPTIIKSIVQNISPEGCLFKKHSPVY